MHLRCRKREPGPGTLVAVMLDRSPSLIASLLGVLMTGAAYMPLDPDAPPSRTTLCLEDAVPGFALIGCAQVDSFPVTATTVVLEEIAPSQPGSFIAAMRPQPDSLAYVLYTSGSTGRPKGVAILHRQCRQPATGNAAHVELQRGGTPLLR